MNNFIDTGLGENTHDRKKDLYLVKTRDNDNICCLYLVTAHTFYECSEILASKFLLGTSQIIEECHKMTKCQLSGGDCVKIGEYIE